MDKIETVAGYIVEAKKVVVFTGAGISTESGIPDFRSPGGIWTKYNPEELTYQRFIAYEASRVKYWERQRDLWPVVAAAKPNAGHIAIADLYRMGKLDVVITQNGDDLHQKSGIPENMVLELHGTFKRAICLQCSRRYPSEQIQVRLEAGEKVPTCDACGGILKPDVVSFGQSMPEYETREAEKRSGNCDIFLVGGSSLLVYPAAQMPLIAKQSGAKLVIVNLMPTPHDDYADVVINEKTGESLSKIVEKAKTLMKS